MIPVLRQPCCFVPSRENVHVLMTQATMPMPRALALACLLVFAAPCAAKSEPQHGLAMHGMPRESRDFSHFPYVNPDAPKGGVLKLGASGSFDSLNPLIVKGEPPPGIREFTLETLMARSQDEPFTLYGLIAETVETPPDRSAVTFHLNPKAHFADGHPITADDVIFSWQLLRDKARPNHTTYYKKVKEAQRLSDHAVRFVFANGGDREMPLILGLMAVLPKHATNAETFDQTSLVPLLGSGPYRLAKADPGRSVTYVRDANYWGRDLAVNRGRFNFDEIRFEYYRDGSTLLEAFKSGAIDIRTEDDPSVWAGSYVFPAVTDGRVVKEEIETGLPAGMAALVFNTRRAVFKDPRVREALIDLFDFEWINKNLYHGLYRRTASYFERSFLSSAGIPASAYERTLLAPHPAAVLPAIMDGTYRMPETDGSGRSRTSARKAYDLLKAAGYVLQDGRLVGSGGQPLAFEILAGAMSQPRLLSSFAEDLKKIGIDATVRVVDSAQHQSRLKDYDFDMIQFSWPASLSPGNEQLFRWSSGVAGQPGSFNYAGVSNPAADGMIKALLAAETPETFASSVRALDRVLRSGHYVIPLYHVPRQWVLHWQRAKRPEKAPLFGYNPDIWWIEEPK